MSKNQVAFTSNLFDLLKNQVAFTTNLVVSSSLISLLWSSRFSSLEEVGGGFVVIAATVETDYNPSYRITQTDYLIPKTLYNASLHVHSRGASL